MAEPHKSRVGFEDTLNFTNSLCVAYTLCSAVLRGWIRRDIYGVDDVVIAAATLTTLGFFAANYVALDHGAGKPWSYIDTAGDVAPFNQVCLFSQDVSSGRTRTTPRSSSRLTCKGIHGLDCALHSLAIPL
jgi:hypothetical protein